MTFLPLADGGYLLGTNRDESPARGPAHPPEVHECDGRRFLAPLDSDAGGSWIAADDRGHALCVLNGDRQPARPAVPDAPSRGLLVLDLMQDPRPAEVVRTLELQRERGLLRHKPFKLLTVEPGVDGAPARMLRIDWDGAALEVSRGLGAGLAISSTYQPDAVATARGRAFLELLCRAAEPPRGDGAADLRAAQHRYHASHAPTAPDGDAFGVCMHRDDAATVSCTLLAVTGDSVSMAYQAGHPCAGGPLQESKLGRRR